MTTSTSPESQSRRIVQPRFLVSCNAESITRDPLSTYTNTTAHATSDSTNNPNVAHDSMQ